MTSRTAQSVPPYSYDEVPYRSFVHPHTHPDNMATIGSLFGMAAPELQTARVLELGCAGGGNIFPLALRYPDASFTGLDLSQTHIALANTHKKKLGLRNTSFEQKDILDVDLGAYRGAFDYIICHGVYSWVPEEVSAKILDLCRECLSENGLAVITYNTLPGWNAVRSLRDMMRYHAGRFASAAEQISQSRELLKFLRDSAQEGSGYKSAIEEELNILNQNDDSYLYHDHLEGINRQFYFYQFTDALQKHGLGYVGDCHLASMFADNLPAAARETLKTMGNLLLMEQYMDFVRNRRFRSSIVCKAAVPLRRDLRKTQILDYHLTANMRPEAASPDFRQTVKFSALNGSACFTTNNEIVGVTYNEIVKSGPRPIAPGDVVARAQAVLKNNIPADTIRAVLVERGLELALKGFLNLHMNTTGFSEEISRKPVVSPLARLQAESPGCTAVTNVLRNSVPVDRLACLVITLLDGTRTLDEVIKALTAEALAGKITVQAGNAVISDKSALTDKLKKSVAAIVEKLAKQALLAG